MTELQRIEFAAAAMACKRMGLLSHTTASRDGREQPGKCVPGRVRHQFRDSPVCVHCGARKGSRSGDGQSPVPQHNRLKDLDLSRPMRTIEILISEPLYAKLVAVAAKTSGHDKPSDLQVANTLAGLAQYALDRAHAQVSKPEPVTKPLDVPPALPKTQTYETSGYLNAPNL